MEDVGPDVASNAALRLFNYDMAYGKMGNSKYEADIRTAKSAADFNHRAGVSGERISRRVRGVAAGPDI